MHTYPATTATMIFDAAAMTIIITTLVTTAGNLLLGLMQYIREGRAHAWAVQQAIDDRDHRIAIATATAENSDANAAKVAVNTLQGVAKLAAKIDENTEISTAAFREANGVNQKIAAIGEMRLKSTLQQQQADQIQSVGEDTNRIVHAIDDDKGNR